MTGEGRKWRENIAKSRGIRLTGLTVSASELADAGAETALSGSDCKYVQRSKLSFVWLPPPRWPAEGTYLFNDGRAGQVCVCGGQQNRWSLEKQRKERDERCRCRVGVAKTRLAVDLYQLGQYFFFFPCKCTASLYPFEDWSLGGLAGLAGLQVKLTETFLGSVELQ